MKIAIYYTLKTNEEEIKTRNGEKSYENTSRVRHEVKRTEISSSAIEETRSRHEKCRDNTEYSFIHKYQLYVNKFQIFSLSTHIEYLHLLDTIKSALKHEFQQLFPFMFLPWAYDPPEPTATYG